MVSANDGRQAFLFGGCRGDGTRLQDSFVLDLANPAGRGEGGADEGDEEAGVEEHDSQVGAYFLLGNGLRNMSLKALRAQNTTATYLRY